MQLDQPQLEFANRSLAPVDSIWSCWKVPDVDIVCFGLVNQGPSGRFLLTGWLHDVTVNQLVGWSLTSLFITNTAISETKGQGWRVILLPNHGRLAIISTSTLAAFLFSSHPKGETDREAHLNYHASAYNRGRQLLHHKTKLNQIQQNIRINLN